VYDKTVPLADQAKVIADRMGDLVGYMEDATFVKWRELALTLSAPHRWAQRAKVDGFSITFAGRNLGTWTNYTGIDPEVNSLPANAFSTADFLAQPQVRYFITRVNVNF